METELPTKDWTKLGSAEHLNSSQQLTQSLLCYAVHQRPSSPAHQTQNENKMMT